jgi:hypothetical protein
MVDPAIWQSEDFAGFTFRQRVLFIGLFSNADDQGRMPAHPALIRSTVFPYDDIPLAEILADLDVIADTGCIELYKANGKSALQLLNWWKYQSPQWAYPSKIDAPENWTDRLRFRKDNKLHTLNWETPGGKAVADSLGKALPKAQAEPLDCGHSIDQFSSSDSIDASAHTSGNHQTPAEITFLEVIGPFEDKQDKIDILAMEIQVGSDAVCESIRWARRKHIPGDSLIQSILTAATKWSTGPPSPFVPTVPQEPVVIPSAAFNATPGVD